MASLRTVMTGFSIALALALPAAAQPAAPPPVRMKVVGPHVLGKVDAPLTMVEFSDYECTFCQQFHARAFDAIKRDFIDTGKLRYVARDFPLPTHRYAVVAARAARCAGEQGRFWEMRAALFANTDKLDIDTLAEMGRSLRLDDAALRACVASNRFDTAIRRDIADAHAAGVRVTPSFVLGRSRADAVEGTRLEGSQPFADYEARIKELLVAP